MNRRNFFNQVAGLIAGTYAVFVPGKAKRWKWAYRKFDHTTLHRNWVAIKPEDWNEKTIAEARKELAIQMRTVIPPEYCTAKHIHFTVIPPCTHGTGFLDGPDSFTGTVGWAYTPRTNGKITGGRFS